MTQPTENTILYRRKFLRAAGAGVAVLAVAPGIKLIQIAAAKPDDEAVTDAVRWGMLIDTTKCTSGCTACVTACEKENGWGSGSSDEQHSRDTQKAQWIRKVDLKDKLTGHEMSLPVMCQHCETAPCVDVCPTGASFKRVDGVVLVDRHICIGCRYCMMACPYKARSFIHEDLHDQRTHAPRGKGCVESCNLCVHRVDKGGTPACVEACNAEAEGAMLFGDLNDPNSEIAQRLQQVSSRQIREDLGLNTGVRYVGL
ncbi:MAG: 4Fe-4S dicluster domain-containing protein [Pseudomonadota bacterium]|nr:4Fe-4S dicluster domain-containing protein [Pseudomonadota bacterium]